MRSVNVMLWNFRKVEMVFHLNVLSDLALKCKQSFDLPHSINHNSTVLLFSDWTGTGTDNIEWERPKKCDEWWNLGQQRNFDETIQIPGSLCSKQGIGKNFDLKAWCLIFCFRCLVTWSLAVSSLIVLGSVKQSTVWEEGVAAVRSGTTLINQVLLIATMTPW